MHNLVMIDAVAPAFPMAPPCIRRISPPDQAGVALYLVDLQSPPSAQAVDCLDLDERARAARFHFPLHGQRFLASHVALRLILAHETGLPPSMRLLKGEHGKPAIEGEPGWHFNLSHSADWALMAVSPVHPVGIDIECLKQRRSAQALAQRTLSPSEFLAWQQLPADLQGEAFLRAWTRKEACLKALGVGLHIEPRRVEVGLTRQAQTVEITGGAQGHALTVWDVPLPIGALAAVAILRP